MARRPCVMVGTLGSMHLCASMRLLTRQLALILWSTWGP